MSAQLNPSAGRTAQSVRARPTVPTVTVVDTALRLARGGIPVFPCDDNKRPLTRHGFKDATIDEAQILRWWELFPEALIGVPTGSISRMLVIDIDPGGIDFWLQHEDLDIGRRHNTRRGYHFLFRTPANVSIRNSAGKLADGVDVRGDGGYIVWWPAIGLNVSGPNIDGLPRCRTGCSNFSATKHLQMRARRRPSIKTHPAIQPSSLKASATAS